MDIYQESVAKHEELGGKLEIRSKMPIKNKYDLSLAYTPGVAEVCNEVKKDINRAYQLTIKKNSVAVVTDGSAVLGLGNIGATAALPVMEGKALLFKEYANIDAYPICIETQNKDELINIIKNISPGFAGINLEDINAPKCFEIEESLQEIGIPVFHDDQHGTAIVLLAALINALKLAKKNIPDLKIVISGAGAAGTAIAEILLGINYPIDKYKPATNIIMCDSKGIIHNKRPDIATQPAKKYLTEITNQKQITGQLADAITNADVFIGVSQGNLLTTDMVRKMADKPIIFAMANPTPEIMPDVAKSAGAFIVGTGRSDFNNQINNVLAFPGIFRGAIDARAKKITPRMKLAAAFALAESIPELNPEQVLPSPLDKSIAYKIAEAVKKAYLLEIN
ncbi:NADP-dependent malic enzyme [Candidatus Margulisiibacteriota bacterium]